MVHTIYGIIKGDIIIDRDKELLDTCLMELDAKDTDGSSFIVSLHINGEKGDFDNLTSKGIIPGITKIQIKGILLGNNKDQDKKMIIRLATKIRDLKVLNLHEVKRHLLKKEAPAQ